MKRSKAFPLRVDVRKGLDVQQSKQELTIVVSIGHDLHEIENNENFSKYRLLKIKPSAKC